MKNDNYRKRVATPNDPKLSDGGGWRAGCTAGGKAAVEAASVTAVAVRCSAWLGVIWLRCLGDCRHAANELGLLFWCKRSFGNGGWEDGGWLKKMEVALVLRPSSKGTPLLVDGGCRGSECERGIVEG